MKAATYVYCLILCEVFGGVSHSSDFVCLDDGDVGNGFEAATDDEEREWTARWNETIPLSSSDPCSSEDTDQNVWLLLEIRDGVNVTEDEDFCVLTGRKNESSASDVNKPSRFLIVRRIVQAGQAAIPVLETATNAVGCACAAAWFTLGETCGSRLLVALEQIPIQPGGEALVGTLLTAATGNLIVVQLAQSSLASLGLMALGTGGASIIAQASVATVSTLLVQQNIGICGTVFVQSAGMAALKQAAFAGYKRWRNLGRPKLLNETEIEFVEVASELIDAESDADSSPVIVDAVGNDEDDNDIVVV